MQASLAQQECACIPQSNSVGVGCPGMYRLQSVSEEQGLLQRACPKSFPPAVEGKAWACKAPAHLLLLATGRHCACQGAKTIRLLCISHRLNDVACCSSFVKCYTDCHSPAAASTATVIIKLCVCLQLTDGRQRFAQVKICTVVTIQQWAGVS